MPNRHNFSPRDTDRAVAAHETLRSHGVHGDVVLLCVLNGAMPRPRAVNALGKLHNAAAELTSEVSDFAQATADVAFLGRRCLERVVDGQQDRIGTLDYGVLNTYTTLHDTTAN